MILTALALCIIIVCLVVAAIPVAIAETAAWVVLILAVLIVISVCASIGFLIVGVVSLSERLLRFPYREARRLHEQETQRSKK
jgi:uncharacterized membrane protein YozB (DUF420 family)